MTEDKSYLVETVDPVDGWTFSGWYNNKACGGAPVTEVTCSSTVQNIDLYGKWTHDACTVTFLADYVKPGRGSLKANDQTVLENDQTVFDYEVSVPYGSTLQNAGKSLPTPVPGEGN